MDRFVAGDRAPSSPEGAKMLACAYPALDRPMILFQNVVEILDRSMPAILLQSLLGFEPHDGRWITAMLVGVDDPRRPMVLSAQSLSEKALGRCCVAFSRQKEGDRRNLHPGQGQVSIYTGLSTPALRRSASFFRLNSTQQTAGALSLRRWAPR